MASGHRAVSEASAATARHHHAAVPRAAGRGRFCARRPRRSRLPEMAPGEPVVAARTHAAPPTRITGTARQPCLRERCLPPVENRRCRDRPRCASDTGGLASTSDPHPQGSATGGRGTDELLGVQRAWHRARQHVVRVDRRAGLRARHGIRCVGVQGAQSQAFSVAPTRLFRSLRVDPPCGPTRSRLSRGRPLSTMGRHRNLPVRNRSCCRALDRGQH